MGVIERLQKRRKYPVTVAGEEIWIRAMTQDESKRAMEFANEEESFGLLIGFGLLNESGDPIFTVDSGEADVDFGRRVLDATDFPTDTRAELAEKILRLTKGPTKEQLEKVKNG